MPAGRLQRNRIGKNGRLITPPTVPMRNATPIGATINAGCSGSFFMLFSMLSPVRSSASGRWNPPGG